mmetsp:Transcript_113995/g.202050  ORF Transcript_113995/g.202050 Transcript_113995/m.202050 type:complete len:234 (-) Transcript_113995:427-1128(-)
MIRYFIGDLDVRIGPIIIPFLRCLGLVKQPFEIRRPCPPVQVVEWNTIDQAVQHLKKHDSPQQGNQSAELARKWYPRDERLLDRLFPYFRECVSTWAMMVCLQCGRKENTIREKIHMAEHRYARVGNNPFCEFHLASKNTPFTNHLRLRHNQYPQALKLKPLKEEEERKCYEPNSKRVLGIAFFLAIGDAPHRPGHNQKEDPGDPQSRVGPLHSRPSYALQRHWLVELRPLPL